VRWTLYAVLIIAGCGGSDVLTGPGVPVELSHESLQGRWVLITSVYTMEANPRVEARFEKSPETGFIIEFDGEGGVSYARVAPDGGSGPTTYTIRGNRLQLDFDYQAEVTTTRLVLTLEDISFDFGGDGSQEPAINIATYHKFKD
jgi:hypothetical protein